MATTKNQQQTPVPLREPRELREPPFPLARRGAPDAQVIETRGDIVMINNKNME